MPGAERTLRGGVATRVDSEIEVKRSRFLCQLVRVETEDAARAVVDDARREHFSARHYCSAFVLGPASAPDQVRRSNDDGEPSGTAGRPMLEALSGRGFIDCVAVVTRYFGGTLLGAGGLARAYSDAVLTTIEDAMVGGLVVQRERRELFSLSLPHADAGRVESELRQRGVTILGTDYGRTAVLRMAADDRATLAALVSGITSGASTVEPIGDEWIDIEPQ
ncbi:MAG: YigZ family protein [Homoserinimonas sp.]